MKIYNTFSERKETIKIKPLELKLFVCGPTVYDRIHLGHARTYIFFDVFVRYLRSKNRKVFYLQNITDVDDKIIARAGKENKSWREIADFFLKDYLENSKKLGINTVSRHARASRFIPQIVDQIKILIRKGHAYKTGDGWYFNLKTFPDYGQLSKRTVIGAEDAVSRIDKSVGKKNKGDFCLWKLTKNGASAAPVWKTALGAGRPGWHIEDTAIAHKFFGPRYDLHGGGVDLKFPHHEAEIAQAESAFGKKPFVKIWMHTGFLTVNEKKMSKSLKNFVAVGDFLKKHDPDALRLMMLSAHYRSPLDYNLKMIENAENSLETIKEVLGKLPLAAAGGGQKPFLSTKTELARNKAAFEKAMEDDVNTPRALAALFDFIASLQKKIWRLRPGEAETARRFLKNRLQIFGIRAESAAIPPKVKFLALRREKLRRRKQFIKADALRRQIESLGYEVKDTPAGPYIKKPVNQKRPIYGRP